MEDDVGQSRRRGYGEELVEGRPPKIEVDEHNLAACASKDNREVRDRHRLPLLRRRRRHRDSPCLPLEVHELEIRLQPTKRFGIGASRFRDRHEAVRFLQPAWRSGNAAEEREPQSCVGLISRPHAAVERLRGEAETDAEKPAEKKAEQRVALGSGPDLRRY